MDTHPGVVLKKIGVKVFCSLSIFTSLMLVSACGDSGPDKQQISEAIKRATDQANKEIIKAVGSQGASMFKPPAITITDSSCAAQGAGVYKCTITATVDNSTQTSQALLKRVSGEWTIVQGSS